VTIADGVKARFRDRAIHAHIRADVEAQVHDPDAFVAAFSPKKTVSAFELRKHRNTMAKTAERNELEDDLRAARRSNPPAAFAAQRGWVGFLVFSFLELITLARVFLGVGLSPEEAYGTALIAAATIVALIEGATRAASRVTRVLCYVALTIAVLGVAWVRAGAFAEGDGALDSVVGGVIAIMGAVGAGVALHYFRRRSNSAGIVQRRTAKLERELRERTREITVAENALIRDEIETGDQAANDTALRTMYARLHRIEAAKLGFSERGSPPSN
jgi:hypothetical protein